MKTPPVPSDESQRLKALQELHILYTEAEERFNRITDAAAKTLHVPIALVSLVDADRQWFKACIGVDTRETPRSISFCGHAILHDDLFIVEDAEKDERFFDNPLVTGPMHIRFYAGRPVKFNGQNVGTMCIMDTKARKITDEERKLLDQYGEWVERELSAYAMQKRLLGIADAR